MLEQASIRAERLRPAPHAACARTALAMSHSRGAPSLRTVATWRPADTTGASTFVHDGAAGVRDGGRRPRSGAGGLQLSPSRDLTVLQVAPQRDGKTPRQRHDADAAQALAAAGEAAVEPLRQSAPGLQPQPAPGELDQQAAHASIARLADALLELTVAACIGRRHQAQAARELMPVGEGAPAEHFLDEHPGALGADRAQSGELCDQWLLAVDQLLAASGFDGSDLLLDQLQPHDFSFEFRCQAGRHLRAMMLPPRRPVAPADDDARAQVVQYEERANPVGMCDALMREALQLTVSTPRVLILRARFA